MSELWKCVGAQWHIDMERALARELAAREAVERDLALAREVGTEYRRERDEADRKLRIAERQAVMATEIAVEANAALAAERVANAGLREILRTALNVGEIRFKTCVLAAQVHDQIVTALSAAPPLPMGALRAASVDACVWFVDGKGRCGAPATWRLEPVSDESHDELSGADGGGGMPPLRLCDHHFGASRAHKNKKHWAAERIPAPASVPPAAAPQEQQGAGVSFTSHDKVICDWQSEPHYYVTRPTPCVNPRPAPASAASEPKAPPSALSAAPPNAITTEKQKDLGALRAAHSEALRLLSGVLDQEWRHKVWRPKVCPKCERLAERTNPLCLLHEIDAFLEKQVAPASVPPAAAPQEVGAAAHGPEIEEEEAMPQTRASGAARRLMRAAEAAACEVRRQEFIWADEILWAAMKPIAVAMKRSHVLEDAQRVYAALENARRFLKDEDEGGALDALAKASPIVADAIVAPASAASEPKATAAAPAPIVRGEDACAKCGCLRAGHHGLGVGCEGVGGNCPCDGVFVPASEQPRAAVPEQLSEKENDNA